MKYTFKCEYGKGVHRNITTVECHAEAIDDLVEMFKQFLLAVGYQPLTVNMIEVVHAD